MPPKRVVQVVVTEEMEAAIDKIRGPLSRSAWMRQVAEQALDPPHKTAEPAGLGRPPERQRRKAKPLTETSSRVPGQTVAKRSDVPLDRATVEPILKSHQKPKETRRA